MKIVLLIVALAAVHAEEATKGSTRVKRGYLSQGYGGYGGIGSLGGLGSYGGLGGYSGYSSGLSLYAAPAAVAVPVPQPVAVPVIKRARPCQCLFHTPCQ
ncbi:hypothetical protein HUJ04_011654 [Dendroctonus ponderosae]|uniref:Uncharacterized protein n=1 Tax=Dendroctonus ponderosae TaxID=77166 RepID=A0AAR5NXU5_DENPD|nr:hypothetical protein HUJ04_011654 [Dendroctonus ponderosae]